MIRGYCDVCNEWATAGDLIPCVQNEDQSPPMTCGLLKPHKCVEMDEIKVPVIGPGGPSFVPEVGPTEPPPIRTTSYFKPRDWPLDENDTRPVTFEDAKRRLIDQSRQAEPPMWSESIPEMSGDDPWESEDAEYLKEEAPEDTDGDYGWSEEIKPFWEDPTYLKYLHQLQAHMFEPVKSDGGSTSYYDLPQDATELNDLVEAKDMGFARGNIFKACYRLGEKAGTDIEYDIKKVIYFAERMLMAHQKGQHV